MFRSLFLTSVFVWTPFLCAQHNGQFNKQNLQFGSPSSKPLGDVCGDTLDSSVVEHAKRFFSDPSFKARQDFKNTEHVFPVGPDEHNLLSYFSKKHGLTLKGYSVNPLGNSRWIQYHFEESEARTWKF